MAEHVGRQVTKSPENLIVRVGLVVRVCLARVYPGKPEGGAPGKAWKESMHLADAYAVLARELEAMRLLPLSNLIALADGAPTMREFDLGGEPIELETVVTWTSPSHGAVRATVHLRGQSTWHHQHVQESITVTVPQAAVGT